MISKCYILMILCTTRFSNGKERRDQSDSSEVLALYDKSLDLRGNLRKYFYAHAGLANSRQNFVCSPLSAMMPLGKLALGADGNTLSELLTAIGVRKESKIKRHFKRMISEMKHLPGVKLTVASKIYVSDRFRLRSRYREKTETIFQSSVERINFEDSRSTANKINNWVSQQTKGNINEIIDASDLESDTVVVIVNAIFFKGMWEEPFKDIAGEFYTPEGPKVIPFMNIPSNVYNYTESSSLDAKLVSVPYYLRKAYFLIVLPNKRHGLTHLLTELRDSPEKLNSAMTRMKERVLNLTMPIFRIESEYNLVKAYKEIGVKKIFKKSSGLSEMVKDEIVQVTNAKQKAFIDVNTEGTKAAASSILQISTLSLKIPTKLYVGHPFLCFVIVENQQLFSAVVVDPK